MASPFEIAVGSACHLPPIPKGHLLTPTQKRQPGGYCLFKSVFREQMAEIAVPGVSFRGVPQGTGNTQFHVLCRRPWWRRNDKIPATVRNPDSSCGR